MIDLEFNMSEFDRVARNMGAAADQMPYALSEALNDAAKVTRYYLVDETWPRSVTVRNRSFIGAALRIDFATKPNLSVSIFDRFGRAHLKMHADSGVRQGRGRIAIPTSLVTRGASGVVELQKPRNLPRAVLKGNLLFRAVGRGKNSKLQLMYRLAASARIRKDVPFREDFVTVMQREMARAFPIAMQKAMATRRAQ